MARRTRIEIGPVLLGAVVLVAIHFREVYSWQVFLGNLHAIRSLRALRTVASCSYECTRNIFTATGKWISGQHSESDNEELSRLTS